MTVVIVQRIGWPNSQVRKTLAVSSAFATAGAALAALVPLPVGWVSQVHNDRFASYHGPNNSITFLHLIVAQQPTPRIILMG